MPDTPFKLKLLRGCMVAYIFVLAGWVIEAAHLLGIISWGRDMSSATFMVGLLALVGLGVLLVAATIWARLSLGRIAQPDVVVVIVLLLGSATLTLLLMLVAQSFGP